MAGMKKAVFLTLVLLTCGAGLFLAFWFSSSASLPPGSHGERMSLSKWVDNTFRFDTENEAASGAMALLRRPIASPEMQKRLQNSILLPRRFYVLKRPANRTASAPTEPELHAGLASSMCWKALQGAVSGSSRAAVKQAVLVSHTSDRNELMDAVVAELVRNISEWRLFAWEAQPDLFNALSEPESSASPFFRIRAVPGPLGTSASELGLPNNDTVDELPFVDACQSVGFIEPHLVVIHSWNGIEAAVSRALKISILSIKPKLILIQKHVKAAHTSNATSTTEVSTVMAAQDERRLDALMKRAKYASEKNSLGALCGPALVNLYHVYASADFVTIIQRS
ncbi:hypothetical protein FVE85_8819 [Porphyridium purpureum]|uniref:Uncharacterized protein n=1 Tax=Porphyridium purpureum TaxID=35688 RepID=A0A5J4YRM2_PORPP|nr:hypothetical protein FVE85_8819 [Porphyridium purpureum]|eukprot:POR2455..scf296_7